MLKKLLTLQPFRYIIIVSASIYTDFSVSHSERPVKYFYFGGEKFMTRKRKGRFIGTALTAAMCLSSLPCIVVSADTVLTDCKTGTEDGYDYELWKDSGNTSMTLTGDGTFSCQWDSINNALFRKGKKFDCTKTYSEIGNISIDFACDYEPNGNSYLCVYGWTKSPLVEYYIVESWGSWRPPGATSNGTIEVDGGVYDVYQTTRENQPSIEGNTTFEQYWSVRRDKRESGVISVSEHFKKWEEMGMKMGNLYEAALNVEGYQSSGKANVYKNNIVIGGEIPDNPTPSQPVEPDENNYYFHSTFESGTDKWQSRGDDVSIAKSSKAAAAGSNSLFVNGRSDNWNGAAYNLDSKTFIPGNTYSFSTVVMQDTETSGDFKLTLQYTSGGEDNYTEVASASAAKGVWTKLENKAFTIPEDASNMILYVEMPESLSDFYIDEAIGAVKGTANPFTSSSSSTTLKGDVNLSGEVDLKDLISLKKYILGLDSDADKKAADVNGNGTVDVADISVLKNIIITPSSTPSKPGNSTVNTAEPTQYGVWENNADISWIDTSKPMVAICFDDGPVGTASSDSSMRILNALKDSGFHSTFFYWGNRINSNNRDEIKYASEIGCEIANHTYTHPYLTKLSADEIRNEVNQTLDILKDITGGTNYLIRPPYLAVNDSVKANSYAPLITCSVDSQDWNNASAEQIKETIISKMNDGTLRNQVVLMHETYSTTAEAMEYLAPYLKENGWQIVNVSEMFKANGKDMYSGSVYSAVQ